MTTDTTERAAELLAQPAPTVAETPARIEALNLCAYDVSETITDLSDRAGQLEEQAAAEASAESNDAKRRARKCELLRADLEYQDIRQDIRAANRVRVELDERAARLRREYRLALVHLGREGD
ncbi:MAG TPA: hypothetical protein VF546_14005 [Pyrinomonadaceae bacterium]|jgi:PAB1-binding protein PBP1